MCSITLCVLGVLWVEGLSNAFFSVADPCGEEAGFGLALRCAVLSAALLLLSAQVDWPTVHYALAGFEGISRACDQSISPTGALAARPSGGSINKLN